MDFDIVASTLKITDEGSIPEMRIWSILLVKSDLNGVYILVEVSFYIYKSGWIKKTQLYKTGEVDIRPSTTTYYLNQTNTCKYISELNVNMSLNRFFHYRYRSD